MPDTNTNDKVSSPRINKTRRKKIYFVIQEGGSSSELYLHAHDSREDAEEDRIECATNGAYRTSDIIEADAAVAKHPDFYEVVDEILSAATGIRYTEQPDPRDDE